MYKTNILVKVMKGKESSVLKNIHALGYDASLLIGDYDIFVKISENNAQDTKNLNQISGIVKLAYAEDRTGELKYVS